MLDIMAILLIRYISQGIPTVLFTSIPFVIHGILLMTKMNQHGYHLHQARIPLYMGVWLVFIHSLLKHKEFRFIQPIIPLISIYIGVYMI